MQIGTVIEPASISPESASARVFQTCGLSLSWKTLNIAGVDSALTPITSTAGSSSLTAVATPEIRPPPPTGTSTLSTRGNSETISTPIVPAPAITCLSL